MFSQLSTWEFVKSLKIEGSDIDMDKFEVQLTLVDATGTVISQLPMDENHDIKLPLKSINDTIYITIDLANKTGFNLNCAVVYLKNDFAIFTSFLHPSVYFMEE
ncbi:MAG: hypothetical protein WDO15_06265 [Bacteroidota bacterium]